MFCFKSTVVLGFFLYTLLLRYPQRKKYCNYGHSFRWILKCRRNILWVKTESLFFKYISTTKARCSTDQRSMATQMLWDSLEEHPRTNSPRQQFYSQLFFKIVKYFWQTPYESFGAKRFCSAAHSVMFKMPNSARFWQQIVPCVTHSLLKFWSSASFTGHLILAPKG